MFDFMLNSVGDKLVIGGEVTLLGIGTVFSVLIIIWVMVELLHLLLGKKSKSTDVKKENVPAPVETKNEAPAPAPVVTESATPDYELIAVITAAIAAASGSAPTSFKVVSFKRANNKFSSGR
ncbi:MAG: OadG family protein [Clostridia bacterium]|nr:OadG family protein [Clostridia bacterium]